MAGHRGYVRASSVTQLLCLLFLEIRYLAMNIVEFCKKAGSVMTLDFYLRVLCYFRNLLGTVQNEVRTK